MSTDRTAGYKLIEAGTLVNFDILNTTVNQSAGGDEAIVRIDLRFLPGGPVVR